MSICHLPSSLQADKDVIWEESQGETTFESSNAQPCETSSPSVIARKSVRKSLGGEGPSVPTLPENAMPITPPTALPQQYMHPYHYDPNQDSSTMYSTKYRTLQNPMMVPEMPKMNNQPPERRVPIWNRAENRKITGNAAPLERNLQRFDLCNHLFMNCEVTFSHS